MLKSGGPIGKAEGGPFRNSNDFFQTNMQNTTTTASHSHENIDLVSMSKFNFIFLINLGVDEDTGFQLPSINTAASKQSPFKGFLDISIVTQKLRKAMINSSEDFHIEPTSARSISNRKRQLEPMQSPRDNLDLIQPKNTRFKSIDKQVQMSPKVLETWINETLQDAEHLDIPGVVLKPEHKNPITRYGIDRMSFSNAGVPVELIDRVYRALFVYSVGFYELIKRCMQHVDKKFTLITNIWKVFAILLEYCCRTDYRMLISEISKEHKAETEKLERDYQDKFREQANHEKILRDTNDTLTKYAEELERERANEK